MIPICRSHYFPNSNLILPIRTSRRRDRESVAVVGTRGRREKMKSRKESTERRKKKTDKHIRKRDICFSFRAMRIAQ